MYENRELDIVSSEISTLVNEQSLKFAIIVSGFKEFKFRLEVLI